MGMNKEYFGVRTKHSLGPKDSQNIPQNLISHIYLLVLIMLASSCTIIYFKNTFFFFMSLVTVFHT